MWLLQRLPVDLSDERDPIAGHSLQELPPTAGLFARMFAWEPGFAYRMHRTATLDIIVIVSGQLELLLDEGTVILGPGDSLIQRGTNHGWRVVGDQPCTFTGVFVPTTA